MSKKEFFQNVLDNFFEEKTCSLEQLKGMLSPVIPIFGKIIVEVTNEDDGGKKIKIIDEDKADMVVIPKDSNVKIEDISEDFTDMSTNPVNLYLDKDNKIVFIEHGLGAFTKANKEIGLFYLSLIGKKVEL